MSFSTKSQAGVAGFQARKNTCLSKRDRSSAGRIDPKAVDICSAINARDEYYTTSSCAGRSFIYCGDGIKAHHHYVSSDVDSAPKSDEKEPSGHGFFHRFRVSHDIIRDAERYFDFTTLDPDKEGFDPSGGGDPVRSVAQYDYKEYNKDIDSSRGNDSPTDGPFDVIQQNNPDKFKVIKDQTCWLRKCI